MRRIHARINPSIVIKKVDRQRSIEHPKLPLVYDYRVPTEWEVPFNNTKMTRTPTDIPCRSYICYSLAARTTVSLNRIGTRLVSVITRFVRVRSGGFDPSKTHRARTENKYNDSYGKYNLSIPNDLNLWKFTLAWSFKKNM